jgi:uncharacterized protein (DUF433 family)
MTTSMITVEIPANVYARLQTLATREHADPIETLDRLVAAGARPLAGVIVADPQMRGGRPVIAGTGVTVRTIVGYYKLGLTPEEIADQTELDLAWVYAALAYYHLNRSEIEADLQANAEEAVKQELGAASRG